MHDEAKRHKWSAVTLRALLAQKELKLNPLHVPEHTLDSGIRWVTVTELVDPAPYLLGDELILTLGSSWTDPESEDIERFIERVSSAGVTAVGIQPEMFHDQVPQRMVDAACQYGVPLIHVPWATSFRSVGEFIVEQTIGDRYHAVQETLGFHADLTEALLSRQGIEGLLSRLRLILGASCAVIDFHGNVLGSRPSGNEWPTDEILRRRGSVQWGAQVGAVSLYPVTVADERVAFLCTQGAVDHPDIIRFAASLVALELARRQAESHGRREHLGQVIGDYIQGDLADHEAFRRLKRAGIDLESANRVILARVDTRANRLAEIPWNSDLFAPDHVGEFVVALVDGLIAAIVPEQIEIELMLSRMKEHLGRLGPVSIGCGNLHHRPVGLRLSWLEAQEGIRDGRDLGEGATLSLPRLMMANMRVPLEKVGEQILAPLIAYDADHDAELVKTLRAFIDQDGQTADAATQLFIHRNTMRYRVQLIERLTQRSLTSLDDIVNFYFALLAYEGRGGPGAS